MILKYLGLSALLTCGTVSMTTSALAADAMTLANRHACLACHAVDKKVIGPSWKAVAQRYAGKSGAHAQVVDSIRYGSSNQWGTRAMQAQKTVSPQDAEVLANFILSLAKK